MELQKLKMLQSKKKREQQENKTSVDLLKRLNNSINSQLEKQDENISILEDSNDSLLDVSEKLDALLEKEPFVIEEKKIEFPKIDSVSLKDNKVEVLNLKDIQIPETKFPEVQKVNVIQEEPQETKLEYDTSGLIQSVKTTYNTYVVIESFGSLHFPCRTHTWCCSFGCTEQ